MYDVNPNIYGTELSLNVNKTESAIDFELAMETTKYYGIKEKEAKQVIHEIKQMIEKNWIVLAKQYGLSRSAIEYMQPAFAMEYK